jgi:hypothetical protein
MAFMPVIDDQMLAQFRRTAKGRAAYRGRRVVADAQGVLLQHSSGCLFPGDSCITPRGELGICDGHRRCIVDPFPGGFNIPH